MKSRIVLLAVMLGLVCGSSQAQRSATNARLDSLRVNVIPKTRVDSLNYGAGLPIGPVKDTTAAIRSTVTTHAASIDSLRAAIVIADTATLKATSGNLAYLTKLGAGSSVGAGYFAKIDSTYPEGIVAFNHPTVGKQWVRTQFLEDNSTIYGAWIGWSDGSDLSPRLASVSVNAAALKARILLNNGTYWLNSVVTVTPPFTLTAHRGDTNVVKIMVRAQNDTITRQVLYLAGGGIVIMNTAGLITNMTISYPSGNIWSINTGVPTSNTSRILRIADFRAGGSEWSGEATFGGSITRQVYWARNYLFVEDTSSLTVGMGITGLGGSVSSSILAIPDTGYIIRTGAHVANDSVGTPTFMGGTSAGMMAQTKGYYRIENITFEGLNQNGYTNAYPFNQNNGHGNRIYIENCIFRNTFEALRFQKDSNEVYVTNCKFVQDTTEYRSTTSGKLFQTAIAFQGAHGTLRVKNVFMQFDVNARRGPNAGVATAGIYSPATNNVYVEDFESHHLGEFMQWYPGGAKTERRIASFNRGTVYNGLFLLSTGDSLNHAYINDVKFIRDWKLLSDSIKVDNPSASVVNLRGGTAILTNCLLDSVTSIGFVMGDSTSLLKVSNSIIKNTSSFAHWSATAVSGYDGRVEVENCSFLDSTYIRTNYQGVSHYTFKNNHFYDDFEIIIYPDSVKTKKTTWTVTDNVVDGNFLFRSWSGGSDTIRSYFIRNPNVGGTKSLVDVPTTIVSAYADITGTSNFASAASLRKAIYIRNLKPTAKFSITPIGTPAALAYEAKVDSLIVTGSDSTGFYYEWKEK